MNLVSPMIGPAANGARRGAHWFVHADGRRVDWTAGASGEDSGDSEEEIEKCGRPDSFDLTFVL